MPNAFIFVMCVRTKFRTDAGFTLVEIMVVICILAMLLAIAVPYYVKQRATAQANMCINNLIRIEAAANQFALETGKKNGDPINFPGDLLPYVKPQAGIMPPCPAGGIYLMPSVGAFPSCSLSNLVSPPHVVP
jgi:prepilin-type N-terminal cleavage/methylation domain-containing protein